MIYKILALILLVFGTAHADTWTSAQRTVDAASGASIKFKNGTTEVGAVDNLGTWTLGPAGYTGVSTVYGGRFDVSNTAGNTAFGLASSGDKWEIQGRSSNDLRFSNITDNLVYGLINGSGSWTLGPDTEQALRMETSTIANNEVHLGANVNIGFSAVTQRNLTTRNGGGIFLGAFDTDASDPIRFYVNQDNDAVSTTGDVAGTVSALGGWNFGPSGYTGTHDFQGSITVTDAAATRSNLEITTAVISAMTGETCVSNCGGSPIGSSLFYIRVGDIVTTNFTISLTPTGAGVTASGRFDPPIASNLAVASDVSGICAPIVAASAGVDYATLGADVTNDDFLLTIVNTTGATAHTFKCTVQYIIK